MKTFRVCGGNFGVGVSIKVDGNKVEVIKTKESEWPMDLEGILEKMLDEPNDVCPHDHGVGSLWWSEEGSSRSRHITTSSVGW